MTDRTQAGGLLVANSLYRFITDEALPAAGIDPAGFWEGAAIPKLIYSSTRPMRNSASVFGRAAASCSSSTSGRTTTGSRGCRTG